ncbi:50S ribosomal protein L10 [Patescibacteria group bacterium]|nr:50S ribosomal protein L10 [Patescibacteria group bacterium]
MAISKDQKKELVQGYSKDLSSASNVVILKQSGIPVNESNALRIGLANVGGKINIVRKRLFLRSLADAGYSAVEHKDLDGATVALYATTDEFAPLKEVHKYMKALKKAEKKYGFEYVGGWFDKEWKDAAYVQALATLPTKEELVGKLLFLLKHPVQKFVATLDAVAKKETN